MPEELPTRSPWIEQLEADRPAQPLTDDADTDVLIVGAGIAGIATAFFVLRETDRRVLLVERNLVGRGATGHNAGQVVWYFERPLADIADEHGLDATIAAQRDVDRAWGLLEEMVGAAGATAPVDRFVGHMGMFTLNHVVTHLRNNEIRRRGGLELETCVVSEEAPFLAEIPAELASLFDVVPQDEVRRRLGATDDRYWAVLSSPKGCANSALVCQQVLDHLLATRGDRFAYADGTSVGRIELRDGAAVVGAGAHTVRARSVVLCTNGFTDHEIENAVGDGIDRRVGHRVSGDVGYMVGFLGHAPARSSSNSYIRNEEIGGDVPYVYVTQRAYERDGSTVGLTCAGGPERLLTDAERYDATAGFPREVVEEFDREVRPIAYPDRVDGAYDFRWHGLMAYTTSRLRLIGAEPRNPVLLYNLGCNGVGLLPAIHGGYRIARLLGGDPLPSSLFDPRA